ncbi:FemAB family XrtA/PEP-CTERM system-associated protein [Stakelama marina]|uniref:FemAB family PEP-CTERM system-associated protein n=1 Tax=Stakelama marina TaxID=2826939 RepID=A0A8T4IBJ1_9SPHN|nr:FemAB family XrtA/PEP-CTERM system-associated protein [Stakelama marina]MBR0551930.1 FemAB family PEP-CTERM system-associated protein [Stakelama marina]
MNAPTLHPSLEIRTVDLADAGNCARIEAFIGEHPEATPFHLPQWLRAVARGCRQRGHYLIAERGDGSLAGVLPLTEVRSLLFGRALVSSGFAVGGGILATNPAAVDALSAAAWDMAERLDCPTLELRGGPNPGNEWLVDDDTYLGFARALADDPDAELQAIPRKQRAEVRRSLKFDLDVSVGRDGRHRAAHYAVYAESVRNLGTPVFPARLFRETLDAFGDDADILLVQHEGQGVAAVLSLYWRGCVYPYWGGGTHAARGLRANDRMYFTLMNHARERGCSRFDFGRSKAGTGPAAFKKNWGFEPQPLTYYKRAAKGEAPREINPLDPKYRKKVEAWQKLPLWLANRVGPHISRGLG